MTTLQNTTAASSQPDLRVQGLERRFGRRTVLRDVSFELPAGGFLLLLGPNGAGKTTLLRIVASLLAPTAGSVHVCGADVREEAAAVRRQIGFVGHSPLLYGDLTARENLRFYGRMYGVADLEARIAALLDRVGLTIRADDRTGDFSKGMRQRLALARALLHEPRVLLLDEPYAGLDAHAAAVLDELLAERAGRATVVLVTHDPARPATWASATLTLTDGRAVWRDGPPALAAAPRGAAPPASAQAGAAPPAAASGQNAAPPDIPAATEAR